MVPALGKRGDAARPEGCSIQGEITEERAHLVRMNSGNPPNSSVRKTQSSSLCTGNGPASPSAGHGEHGVVGVVGVVSVVGVLGVAGMVVGVAGGKHCGMWWAWHVAALNKPAWHVYTGLCSKLTSRGL